METLAGQLIKTPHPVTQEGQTSEPIADLIPGESLRTFLTRHVPDIDSGRWKVRVAGLHLDPAMWDTLQPQHGQHIEIKSTVGEDALRLVAFAVLMYFTMGAGGIAGGAFMGMTGFVGYAAAGAAFIAGSIIINKVLPPKTAGEGDTRQAKSVYNLGDQRNQIRQHAPIALCFGEVKIAPDVISAGYPWYQGEDQYIGMILTPGINCDRVQDVFLGDSLIQNFQEVRVTYNGFPGMPSEPLALYSNADLTDGGTLEANETVVRTSSPNAIRLQVNIEYMLFDTTSKGNPKQNQEQFAILYRPVGGGAYTPFQSAPIRVQSDSQDQQRVSYSADVPKGQYEVAVTRLGMDTDGKGARANFSWSNLVTFQADEATYSGIPRIGFSIRASGQISSTVDEIRMTAIAGSMPYWNGAAWVTATARSNGLSNPGAQLLQYARGFRDSQGNRIAGIGLSDDMIDIESLKDFMMHCASNGYHFDAWITDARNHSDLCTAIALSGMGEVSWGNGKFGVVWAAKNQGLKGVVNMAVIRNRTFQVDYALVNSADGINYTYFDRTDWATKTLRIPAPGVTTILNPVNIQGEGVTDAAHALTMARYHMGQNIYQYKEVGYGTDTEFMTYRRLALISLQNDLTQWGQGGRLEDAALVGGLVPKLAVDDELIDLGDQDTWIGVRIPGEDQYRVFPCTRDANNPLIVQLNEVWPSDVAFPGTDPNHPPEDYLWCYDIKSTPGARMRVVSITPGSNFKDAEVRCVPETDEFWHYVETGEYFPPQNQSLLPGRPVATDLKVTEQKNIQGDTSYYELTATFEVSGYMSNASVYCNREGESQKLVASLTSERKATWRINEPGAYFITVQPYGEGGRVGVPAQILFNTEVVGVPPPNFDIFSVTDMGDGTRKFEFDYSVDEIAPADLMGAYIRMQEGTIQNPSWDNMSPLIGTGFHTAGFQASVPNAGQWTFAIRAVTTAGILSPENETLVIFKTLTKNLFERLETADNAISQEIVDRFNAIEAEAQARLAAIAAVIEQITAESEARTEGLSAEAAARIEGLQAQADALLAERTERIAAVSLESSARQSDVESLAFQISQISAGTGMQFDSKKIWYFDTDNEGWNGSAAGGLLNPGATTALSPAALGIDGNAFRYIKMRVKRFGTPAWTGKIEWQLDASATWNNTTVAQPAWDNNGYATVDLNDIGWAPGVVNRIRIQLPTAVTANDRFEFDWIAIGRPTPGASVALVNEEREARIAGDTAEATSRNTLAVQMRGNYTGDDVAGVTAGLVYSERVARTTADGVLAGSVEALSARMPPGAGLVASQADILEEREARVSADGALAQSITSLTAQFEGEYTGDTDDYTGDTDAYSGTITVYTVIADGDQAIARNLSSLEGRYNQFESTATQQIQTVSTGLQTQAQQITTLNSDLAGKASAQAVTLLTTRVTNVEGNLQSAAEAITQINSTLPTKANTSAVNALQTQVTDLGGNVTALSNSITSVQASLGDKANASVVQQLTATVNSQGGAINNINAQYFLSVNANGLIGGMKFGNDGTTVGVQFISDSFTIVNPGATQRTEFSQGNWRIYDANGVLRVRMGVWP